jgi:hypothetical protein
MTSKKVKVVEAELVEESDHQKRFDMVETQDLERQLANKQQAQNVVTPMHLLQVAMQTEGVDLDRLERLMLMQTQYEEKQAKKEYIVAMTDFKAECPVIAKLTPGQSNKYADLATIAEAIDPLLSKNGLSYRWDQKQSLDKKEITITCIVTHVGGHSEKTPLTAGMDTGGNKNAIQALGSSNSYLFRYTLNAALGLASKEMDDDGKEASTPPAEIIDENQWRELDVLISQIDNLTVDQFCIRYKIAGLDLLHASLFDGAKKFLNKRLEGDK